MAALEDFAVGSQHRGWGLEPRPHPREELTGAHRAWLARQVKETPAVLIQYERPPRPGGDAARTLAATLAAADRPGVGNLLGSVP